MAGEVSMLHTPAHVAWRPAVEELVLASKPHGVQARCCAQAWSMAGAAAASPPCSATPASMAL